MGYFILFIIGIFLVFVFAIVADNRRNKNVRKKQCDDLNGSRLSSNKIDYRFDIKKRGEFDSKTEHNSIKYASRKPLKPCGTRSAVDPIGRNGNNTYAPTSEVNPSHNGFVYMSKKQLSYYFSHLKGELFTDYLLAESDNSLIKVSNGEFSTMIKKKNDHDMFSKALSETANNNNVGIAFEKSGDIDSAIEAYERNIGIAYPALHSYERLMVLYRKEKRYDDEIRVIEKSINDFPAKSYRIYIDKWKNRLEKAKKLNSK